jgi:hypothetical protein
MKRSMPWNRYDVLWLALPAAFFYEIGGTVAAGCYGALIAVAAFCYFVLGV